jgi:hypothetical protein
MERPFHPASVAVQKRQMSARSASGAWCSEMVVSRWGMAGWGAGATPAAAATASVVAAICAAPERARAGGLIARQLREPLGVAAAALGGLVVKEGGGRVEGKRLKEERGGDDDGVEGVKAFRDKGGLVRVVSMCLQEGGSDVCGVWGSERRGALTSFGPRRPIAGVAGASSPTADFPPRRRQNDGGGPLGRLSLKRAPPGAAPPPAPPPPPRHP